MAMQIESSRNAQVRVRQTAVSNSDCVERADPRREAVARAVVAASAIVGTKKRLAALHGGRCDPVAGVSARAKWRRLSSITDDVVECTNSHSLSQLGAMLVPRAWPSDWPRSRGDNATCSCANGPGPKSHFPSATRVAMDFARTDEQESIRSAVRSLCAQFPDEYWRELDRASEYPERFVRALTEAGWLAALIPTEYGGTGLGIADAAAIIEEINASGGNAAAAHAQMYTMGTLLRHGSDEQKRRYLPRLAKGELRLQAFGVTEPEAGSETTRIKTMATRRGDRYVINGKKIFISARSIPICCFCSRARRRTRSSTTRREGSRCSSWICVPR